ncbi:MAG: class I SAM-dependent methyltransferase [Patescibacteria group bacterium]
MKRTFIHQGMSDLGVRDRLRILFRHYILHPLFGDMFTNTELIHELIEYYDGYQLQNANSKKGILGFGLIHYALITNLRPRRLLCIGSKKGFVPAICALACKHNGFGKVDFVDAGYGESDATNQWGGVSLWRRINPRSHFSFLGLDAFIQPFIMTTKEFIKREKHRYQYIHVDGDHSYEGVKNDVLGVWPRLSKNGYLVLHDVTVRHMNNQPDYGVWRLWNEISGANKILVDQSAGLGIIQKKSNRLF